jgi:hypothetical protein
MKSPHVRGSAHSETYLNTSPLVATFPFSLILIYVTESPGTYGLSLVVQTISLALCDVISHSLSSNRTLASPSRFSPIKVTEVPPRTDPYLGLISVIAGVTLSE